MLTNNYVKMNARNEWLLSCLEKYHLISKPLLDKIKANNAYAKKELMSFDGLLAVTEKNLTYELLSAVWENINPLNLRNRLQ